MTPLYYANLWYGKQVSSRARKYGWKGIQHMDKQPKFGFEQKMATGAIALGAGPIAHSPHIVMGMSPYLFAGSLASKAEKARRVVNLHNMGLAAKAMYIAKPSNLLKTYLVGGLSWLPSAATAKKAARTAKIAGRFAPVVGVAALAHDVYDIVVNQSFWGISFGNPTPGDRWWN
jgi:hypothetical protein